ncbi:hypothetical protein [Glutamicibacter sp. M10]|uniref:hypothetical protein n=1 Tax=Glutamicibacter sp. M10 TaxID=3023076 RepID=UPI0021CA26DC|nr:hypothetical protein [Glutamicibacter sp. M10]UXN30983.1 hypothetical protein N6V40_11175 [Glutamicibacter sp. M10]
MPAVGDLVKHTVYQPDAEPKTQIYKPTTIMLVRGVTENYRGVQDLTRYWLADPRRPNDESRFSWTESDWADVEPAAEELGRLF